MKTLSLLFIFSLLFSVGCNEAERSMLPDNIIYTFNDDNARVPVPLFEEEDSYPDVLSPIPFDIQETLWGNWEDEITALQAWLDAGETQPDPPWAVTIPREFPATNFCQQLDRRQFYDKYIDAGGIAIIGPSARTSYDPVLDRDLYWTRDIILTMTSKMPRLRQTMSPNRFVYIQVGGDINGDVNFPDELAGHAWHAGYFQGSNVFQIGIATGGPTWYHVTGKTALHVKTVVHEFAHAIHHTFKQFPHLRPGFDARLEALYENAKQKAQNGNGYFNHPNDHAMANRNEYWATGAHKWFHNLHGDPNTTADGVQLELMQSEDAGLYALLAEVFPIVDLPTYLPEDFNK